MTIPDVSEEARAWACIDEMKRRLDTTGIDLPYKGPMCENCKKVLQASFGSGDRDLDGLTFGEVHERRPCLGLPDAPESDDEAIRVLRMRRAWAAWDRYCDTGDKDAWDEAIAFRVFVYLLEYKAEFPAYDRILAESLGALIDHRHPPA